MIIKVLIINILLFVLSACTSMQKPQSGIDKHTIQSSELRLLMRELDTVVDYRFKSELERDNIRRRYALNLADTIKELSYEIECFSRDELSKTINKKNMYAFSKNIKELQKQADEITKIAQRYEFEKLDRKIEEIKHTCNACHSTYRSH